MKACCIFKTKTRFKIATAYKTDTGCYVLREPIFLLDLEISDEDFQVKLLESLAASRLIPYPVESFTSQLLKKMKEPSFRKLYLKSSSCNIFLENNLITIEPNICRHPDQGLEVVQADIQTLEYNKLSGLKVIGQIRQALDKKRYSTST